MNPHEIAKIMKTLVRGNSNVNTIHGCYIDDTGQAQAKFSQTESEIGEAAWDSLLKCIRKGISGSVGRNLIEADVPEGKAGYKTLNKLRDSEFKDESALSSLLGSIQRSEIVDSEKNNGYIILMAYNEADLSRRGKEDDDGTVGDAEDEGEYVESGVFRYIVCVAFGLKAGTDGVGFFTGEKKFKNVDYGRLLGTPIVGFMYPAYDKGGALMEKVDFHVQNESNLQTRFIRNVFSSEPPTTFTDKKERFGQMMKDSLLEDCSIQNIVAVCNEINQRDDAARAEAKEQNRRFKPEILTAADIGMVLRTQGADATNVEEFVYQCNSEFDPVVDEEDNKKKPKESPRDFFDTKKIKVEMSRVVSEDEMGKVVVTADMNCSDLISTRLVDGRPCIVIEVDGEARINDLPINIA